MGRLAACCAFNDKLSNLCADILCCLPHVPYSARKRVELMQISASKVTHKFRERFVTKAALTLVKVRSSVSLNGGGEPVSPFAFGSLAFFTLGTAGSAILPALQERAPHSGCLPCPPGTLSSETRANCTPALSSGMLLTLLFQS